MAYDLYPAVDETYNFPPEIRQSLARSLELRNDVEPMTTALRNNLQPAELWDGRTIANTTTDRLERYDATLLQWFPVADLSDITKTVGLVPTGRRNILRNGDMQIAQRGDGPFAAAVSNYTVDAWRTECSPNSSLVTTRILESATKIPMLRLVTTLQTGAGHYVTLTNVTEDVRNLAGKVATISFLAFAATGAPEIGVSINQNFGSGGSPSGSVHTVVGKVAISTALVKYSITFTVPPLTGKTMGTNPYTSSTSLSFWLSAGSGTTAISGGIGLQNNTFYISDVQFEEGNIATAFERLSYAEQLSLSLRYFQRITPGVAPAGTMYIAMGRVYDYTRFDLTIPTLSQMRAVPSITASAANTFQFFGSNYVAYAGTGVSFDPSTPQAFHAYFTGISPGAAASGDSVELVNYPLRYAFFDLSAEM